MKKLLFIFNPHSGKGLIGEHLLDIINVMVKAGYDPTVYPTQARGDGERKAREEAGNYDLIVCSGGDGTLDEVVAGVHASGIPAKIGYIPAGSTNDFANSLGIPMDMVEAAGVAVNGKPFSCDIGALNGEIFVYVAAFGIFTKVSYETPQELKNVFGHAAYILEGARQLHDVPSYTMIFEHDGQIIEDTFVYGMITNSDSVGGFKGLTGADIELDDGLFEVTLVRTPHNPIELNEILRYLTFQDPKCDMVYTFKTDKLIVHAMEPVAWTRDGEYGGTYTNMTIRNLEHNVQIMIAPDQQE